MNNPYPHRIDPDVPTPRPVPSRAIILGVVFLLLAFCAAAGFFLISLATTEYEPVPEVATITISGNAQQTTVVANGEPVTVSGNANTVTITGDCTRLTMSGNANRVDVDVVDVITVSGNANAVQWKSAHEGDAPQVATSGNANVVERQ